jgi:pimeloyl-ACP methyl ester carboxylesterase
MQIPTKTLNVVGDSGKGRATVVLCEERDTVRYNDILELSGADEAHGRTVRITVSSYPPEQWALVAEELFTTLSTLSIRQAHLVSCGAGGSALAQALMLAKPKLVRTMILVDPATRAMPTILDRAIERVERALPLGLPFRSTQIGFDSKPYLQRMRCPVLIVTTARASAYENGEAATLVASLPTAWVAHIERSEQEAQYLLSQWRAFQETPAKCPQ